MKTKSPPLQTTWTRPASHYVPKVLVGCPTYREKAYSLERYAERVKALDYPNYDILLVDTSDDGGAYRKKVEKLGLPCVTGPKQKQSDVRVAAARNVLRKHAVLGGYDYYFSLEQDVIPPTTALKTLVSHKKDVVGGWYYTTVPVSAAGGGAVTRYLKEPCLVVKEPKSASHADVWSQKQQIERHLCDHRLLKVDIGSFGICLVSRRTLEEVPFHHDPNHQNYDDVIFYRLLRMRKIPAYVDTDLLVAHFQTYEHA